MAAAPDASTPRAGPVTLHDPTAILRQLEQVLLSRLAPDVAAFGGRIVSRLKGPVRIALIGRAGAGKTLLAELLSRQTDLPACQFSETTLGKDTTQLRTATAQADLVLWCTQGLGADEALQWSTVPDVIKDHSFLILTKADLLAGQGRLQSVLHAMAPIAAEEFLGIFPLATPQAIASQGPDQTAAFRASGSADFVAALRHQVGLDRRATQDSAYLFLERYADATLTPIPPQPSLLPPEHSVWVALLTYFKQQALVMQDAALMPLPDKIQTILDHCRATADGLANLIDQCTLMTPQDTARAQEILTVADTMVLLKLEGSCRAATDALDLLLQLRRDLIFDLNSDNVY